MKNAIYFSVLGLLIITLPLLAQAPAANRATEEEFFEVKVRPVLAEHCYSCHGPMKQQGSLRLDRRDEVLKRSEGEPVVIAEQPEKSLLIKAIRHGDDLKMPPKSKLSDAKIADLTTWVQQGAHWPEEKLAKNSGPNDSASKHWAFQPVHKTALPSVRQADWVSTPVDQFILAKLEEKGVTPNPQAERRILLRRLKYDLVGLPATYDEIRDFEQDTDPDAYVKRVDAYLASPQYGERWARHWLDVARYSDTKGYVFQEERRYAYAYTYRDYVVKAFNQDLPYDQFIVQQLAADRLVALKQAPESTQAAMGYLTLGRRFLNNIHDIIDDRIDVVSRGMLGLTLTCCRCHDHKYDPLSMKDYYGIYGVFASSTEPKELPLLGEPERTPEFLEFEKKLQELETTVRDFETKNKKELSEKNRKVRDELKQLVNKVQAHQASSSGAPPRGMILRDSDRPLEPHIFLRGNPGNQGPAVPRQFLEVLSKPDRHTFKDGSGRLELARAIATADNPLTSRVIVNRVWMHHFGSGLVTSPSDFGIRSDPPSHPELLDYLAARFTEEGWSLKQLHRWIVLSKTYQLSSVPNDRAAGLDPENRWLARFPRHRLDFEQLRDSLLAVSGQIQLRLGGRGVELTKSTGRRTLYGTIERQNLPGVFRTFDFANPDLSNPQRFQTTVPQQALYLLNNPLIHEQARQLLHRSEMVATTEPSARVGMLYRLVLGRDADADELALGVQFVERTTSLATVGTQGLTPWERYGQVLLLSNEFAFVD